MATIILQIVPADLVNPDLDLRYLLPDLLVARSKGLLTDAGYDYADGSSNAMFLFLNADQPNTAVGRVIEILKDERVLGNDLSSIPVGIEEDDRVTVLHPPDFSGTFYYRAST